jgi:hypothetical protein
MWVSSSAARGPPTRGNSRHAGVAQSVAQLSCKQQVRGSSPLASSTFGALDRPGFQLFSHTALKGQAFNQVNLATPRCRGVPKRTAEKSIHRIEVESATGSRAGQPGLVGERSAGMVGPGTRCRWSSTLDQSP